MSTRLVKGTDVVSLADGAELGEIENVYLEPEQKQIVAFSFKSGSGLFSGKSINMVDITDVHAIGPDAVTITDASVVRCEMAVGDRREGLVELDDLLKRKVMTDTGEEIGQISAIHFDQGSYRLSGLDVTSGHFHQQKATVDAAQILQIGDDLVLIREEMPAVERQVVRAKREDREPLLKTVA
jgi:sporulation protein YlmC with PRC-barrel domain